MYRRGRNPHPIGSRRAFRSVRERNIGGRGRKKLVAGLAFAVGKQVAFRHQCIGGGELPIPSEAAVHPPPSIVAARAVGLNRIACLRSEERRVGKKSRSRRSP